MFRVLLLTISVLIIVTACSPANSESKAIVLSYHHLVTDTPQSESELCVTAFLGQMQYLYDNDYKPLTLDQFIAYHNQGQFPDRAILITFDDGYYSFFEHAFPILEQFNFPATIFPVVSHTPGLQRRIIWYDKLSFRDMRILRNSGLIDIGSHTYDLHHLEDETRHAIKRAPHESEPNYRSRISQDLRLSKDLLELQTDTDIISLAWPYGVSTSIAEQIALDLGFELLFSITPGYVTPKTPLTNIPRFAVVSDCMQEFKAICNHE